MNGQAHSHFVRLILVNKQPAKTSWQLHNSMLKHPKYLRSCIETLWQQSTIH